MISNLSKNLTIKQVSISVSLLLVFLNILLFSAFYFLEVIHTKWSLIAIALIAIGLISYFVVRMLLENYILSKIKLIYKIIGKPKNKIKDDNEASFATLDKVSEEVSEWVDAKEKQIQDFRKLEDYRKNYVGTISHELKTPLFTVQGFVHTLMEGGVYDDKINMQYLQRSMKNLDRLKNIVDDLELINKLESGKFYLQVNSFDIKKLVEEVFQDMENHLKEKKCVIRFKEDASQTHLVEADRENIRTVLNNLIVNGVKYGREKGVIEVGFYDINEYILVEVSDNGIGISEEHIKHLFDRFYRVDPSRSRSQGGSGLGLSIVKHIIEAHQQTINVRSIEGEGTTFGFTLKKIN